jgi:hypothetical protein
MLEQAKAEDPAVAARIMEIVAETRVRKEQHAT